MEKDILESVAPVSEIAEENGACENQERADANDCADETADFKREIKQIISDLAGKVTALEEKGLIIRKQDSNDRRVWRVYPTEKMQQLLPVVRQVMGEWNEYLLEELSQQEREVLVQALEKVTARANEAARELLGGRERQP